MNKETRRQMIEKYLDAGTDARQERMLAGWFATHAPEEGEESAARLILAEHPEAAYEADGKEFDALMARSRRRSRAAWWALGAAASIALASGLWLALAQRDACPMSGQEMVQGMESIMALGMEDVESITARPQGGRVVITVVQADGRECHYLMSQDRSTAAITITATNGDKTSIQK